MAEITKCKEVHDRDIYFAISEQCYHLSGMDGEADEVSLVDALTIHIRRQMPESYSIVCLYMTQNQTLPIFD